MSKHALLPAHGFLGGAKRRFPLPTERQSWFTKLHSYLAGNTKRIDGVLYFWQTSHINNYRSYCRSHLRRVGTKTTDGRSGRSCQFHRKSSLCGTNRVFDSSGTADYPCGFSKLSRKFYKTSDPPKPYSNPWLFLLGYRTGYGTIPRTGFYW